MKIIEPVDGHSKPRTGAPAFEPELAFVLPGLTQLRLTPPAGAVSTGAFFAHQVARHPQDLRAHVQRILLHVRERDAEEALGALIDLFLVLGENGLPLRRRMLDAATPLLNAENARTLAARLNGIGSKAAPPFPVTAASVLSNGSRGSTALVERIGASQTTPGDSLEDILEEARSRLEYGQVEEARELLEEAVLNEPRRRELHLELLEIYRGTRNAAHLLYMWNLLDTDDNPAADVWLDTARLLDVELAG